MQMNMGLRCNMTSITEIGDKLLTAYVDGDYQEVLDLWTSVAKDRDNIERIKELHKYSNPNITGVKLAMAVVIAAKSLKSWKNKES